MTKLFAFDNSYARLPAAFFARVRPTPVRAPSLIAANVGLAEALGADMAAFAGPGAARIFAGNDIVEGWEPIATAYAGHQFGQFVPQLGDGRAILLGEVATTPGARFDVQLKGAGRTPFSRNGDGRAALGPVLREYIVSEAMAALGVPTTRALAAVTTGENVQRERALPGAILVRVASSHIRVGTFQFFAARRDLASLRALTDHVLARHYPAAVESENRALALLEAVVARHARLVANWLHIGFVHGVMNTDNSSIAGETLDFGPCAFIDAYDPEAVFSSIDANGRYAFDAQPNVDLWNLTRLAECLLPLIDEDEQRALALARATLSSFAGLFEAAWSAGMRRKLGLAREEEGDLALVKELLAIMAEERADFTVTFRGLCDAALDPAGDEVVRGSFAQPQAFDAWAARWRDRSAREIREPRLRRDDMRRVNPAYIPRNHRIEAVIAAAEAGDFTLFHAMNAVLSTPFEETAKGAVWAVPPTADERVRATFCGT